MYSVASPSVSHPILEKALRFLALGQRLPRAGVRLPKLYPRKHSYSPPYKSHQARQYYYLSHTHRICHVIVSLSLTLEYYHYSCFYILIAPPSFHPLYLILHTFHTTSSTRSLIAPSSIPPETDTSSSMAAMDNGKAPLPANGFRNGAPGGEANNRLINVQPPRREDLQPAYAQTLQGESEDAGSHGWYGSMSMLPPFILQFHLLTCAQSILSVHSSVAAVPSHAASFAPTHTNQSAKETSAWSPSSVAFIALLTLVL